MMYNGTYQTWERIQMSFFPFKVFVVWDCFVLLYVGVELLGAKVDYVKPKSSYPSMNEQYKTDSKFIGVS